VTHPGSRPGGVGLRQWVADETWLKHLLTARPWMTRAYFEARYLVPDPWRLQTSGYERGRAEASLRVLEGRRYVAAIDVGCGEGTFTARLLDRCDSVVAVDFSTLAVRRAQRRFADSPRVEVRRLDLRTDDLDRTFDLVFCAELFYYFNAAEREQAGARLARWVAPGGDLCLVHGTSAHDRAPQAARAECSGRLSAEVIHDRFRAMTAFTAVRDVALAPYRLTLFRRIEVDRG